MGLPEETENGNKCRMDDLDSELADLLNGMEIDETPLLTNRVKKIVEEVVSEAERQAKSRGFPTGNDSDLPFRKLCIVKENLEIIIKEFKKFRKAKQQFINKYPTWQEARSRSIDALQTIGNSMNDYRRNSNIVRVVGNSTSFVGGGICIASAALIPFTFGLTTPLLIAGGITTALGSATTIGTCITETILLKNKVEEAKAIVENDRLSFEALEDWFNNANAVTKAMDAILSIDVDNKIINVIEIMKNFVFAAVKVHSTIERIPLVRDVVKIILGCLPTKFLLLTVVSSLIGFFMVLAVLYHMDESMFSNASNTWKTITTHISSAANATLGVLQPAATIIFQSDVMVARNVAKVVVARGLVAVIGMSLDVASIVLTSIDLHNGSVCEEGQKIMEAADKMKEEADILEEVYANLTFSDE